MDGVPEGLILVTGAGGGAGSVSRAVVGSLLDHGRPVRAMVHREDERADRLRDLGAEVVVGDLTNPPTWRAALDGARRMFFSMSVAPTYLQAAATVATVARAVGGLDVLVGHLADDRVPDGRHEHCRSRTSNGCTGWPSRC